jgi:hypothetical protein
MQKENLAPYKFLLQVWSLYEIDLKSKLKIKIKIELKLVKVVIKISCCW